LESDEKKDMSVSILPFADENFQTKMMEIEIACQVSFKAFKYTQNLLLFKNS
jgi:hypothetical protein